MGCGAWDFFPELRLPRHVRVLRLPCRHRRGDRVLDALRRRVVRLPDPEGPDDLVPQPFFFLATPLPSPMKTGEKVLYTQVNRVF